MNLEHLSSRMRLDMDHLQWEARSQHLNNQQFRERFDYLASGYCSLVGTEDLPAVKQMVRQYQHQFHLQ